MIHWHSEENHLLLNPRIPIEDAKTIKNFLCIGSHLKGMIWLCTSGSTGKFKLVGIKKTSVLASAAAVNQHLQSTQDDTWLNVLPSFHVGGLGILARSFLSGAQTFTYLERWDPDLFIRQVIETQATLTSLVPTQLFDLIQKEYMPPQSLRAILIGGGAISKALYFKAVQRGWKILPSYGLTECASQVACALLGSWSKEFFPLLSPLSHIELRTSTEGFLEMRSPALFTAMLHFNEQTSALKHIDLKDGWWTSEDKAELINGAICNIYRDSSFIKIGGETCYLSRLEEILEEICLKITQESDLALIALPDERLGHAVHLIATYDHPKEQLQQLVDLFNMRVLPFERIRKIHYVNHIPRSPLNKLLREELKNSFDLHNHPDNEPKPVAFPRDVFE